MLNISIKDAPNFIRISISSIKKKTKQNKKHGLLTTKLCDSSPDFIFSIYCHRAIGFIESKICKPLAPNSKKRTLQIVCSIFFGKEFINIARILRDPDIAKPIIIC